MTTSNKSRKLRNSALLSRFGDAPARGIASGRGARSGSGAHRLVWLRQSDTALRRSSRIPHLHPGLHSESRDFPAPGFSQSDLPEADDRCHCRCAFAVQLFFFSGLSATIDEVPDYMSNFSNVGMDRDVITIRQHKSREPLRIRLERILQMMERHANLYTCLGI